MILNIIGNTFLNIKTNKNNKVKKIMFKLNFLKLIRSSQD